MGYNIPWNVVEPDRRPAPCSGGNIQYDGYCYKDVIGNQIESLNNMGIRVSIIDLGIPIF